jgi:hypothetical protein
MSMKERPEGRQDRPGRRRADAAKYLWEEWGLRYAPTTLAQLASRGKGPVYSFRGRYTEYQDADLDTFAQTKISGPIRKASEASPPSEAA